MKKIIVFIFLIFLNLNSFCQEKNPEQPVTALKCPVDNAPIPDYAHKTGDITGKDSDFIAHYENGLPYMKIYTCPTCYFSGPENWFAKKIDDLSKEFFLTDNSAMTRFQRDLGRKPDIQKYADRCALSFYSSFIIYVPNLEKFDLAIKAAQAFRDEAPDIENSRTALIEFSGIKMIAGEFTLIFDFKLISQAILKLNKEAPDPEENTKVIYAISAIFRYHGENPKALYYIDELSRLLKHLNEKSAAEYMTKIGILRTSIKEEQQFQILASSFLKRAVSKKEISFLDIAFYYFHLGELNRRLNQIDEARKCFLIAQKFSMPEKSELIQRIDKQSALVGIEVNPGDTPPIYQYIFLFLALMLYGYIEIEGKAIKEFDQHRRQYYFRRSAMLLLIASFICFQATRVFISTMTAQITFLLANIFLIFMVYIIRANLRDRKYFPVKFELTVKVKDFPEFLASFKARLEEKLFDVSELEKADTKKSKFSFSCSRKTATLNEPLKSKITIDINKKQEEMNLKAEVIPLQPIIIHSVDLRLLRRMFRYILFNDKSFSIIKHNPMMFYFLVPLILVFVIIRIGAIINPAIMMYIPHHYFIVFPFFILSGIIMTLIHILLKKTTLKGLGFSVGILIFMLIFSIVSLYLAWFYSI